MPVVSATDIPRPDAPQPVPVQAPDAYQRIPSDVGSFGGFQAQAMSSLGAEAQKAGANLFDIAIRRQELHNSVAADNQINNYNDQVTAKETAFYALHGQAAVDAYPAFRDDLVNSRNQMSAQMQNQMQQLEFDRQTRRIQSITLGRAGIHYDQQYDAFQKATNDAGYRLNKQGAAAAAGDGDDGAFNARVAGMMQSKLNEVARLGGGPAMVDEALGQVRAEATEMRVQEMGVKNPAAAQAYLDANRDVIPAEKYKELSAGVRSQADQIAGQSDADEVARRNGLPGVPGAAARGARAAAGPGFEGLWTRVKGREGGIGPGGEALVSRAGAIGISQIIPSTAQKVAADLGLPYDEKRLHTDQAYNEQLGREYLRQQLETYGGNQMLAAAAYNAGPERVDDWIKQFGDPRTGAISETAFAAKIPINETRNYVRAVGAVGAPAVPMQAAGTQVAAATPTTTTDVPPGAPAAAPAPGAPLSQSTIDTLKAGGMSDAEIARVQSATTGPAPAPAGPAPSPGTAAAPGGPPATAAPTAAVAPPGMPRKSLEEMVSELPTVDAQGQPISETRQRAAITALTKAYNLHTAAMRGEVATVKQLQKDDLASIAQTGKPIPQLTDARIAAALGPEEAETYSRDRDLAQNYYAETNDFDRLSTFDLNQRLERLRTAGEGQPGYAMKQQLYVKAQQEATRLEHLRMTDPASAVARFPEVIAASQGADLQNPATYQGLAQARMRAFQTLGIPSDAQVPITNEEAALLWRPIGDAARLGDAKTTRQELEKTIRYAQTGWGDQANVVLAKILQMGHADQATRDQALSALKRIGAANAEQARIQQQHNRAIDQAGVAQSVGQAVAGVPPPPAPPSSSLLPYSTSPESAPIAPPAPAAPPGRAYPAPDTEAIDMLRKQPALAAQFDATYGPGKAQQVLGIAPPRPPGAGASAAQPAAR